jgi:hypothetical protein
MIEPPAMNPPPASDAVGRECGVPCGGEPYGTWLAVDYCSSLEAWSCDSQLNGFETISATALVTFDITTVTWKSQFTSTVTAAFAPECSFDVYSFTQEYCDTQIEPDFSEITGTPVTCTFEDRFCMCEYQQALAGDFTAPYVLRQDELLIDGEATMEYCISADENTMRIFEVGGSSGLSPAQRPATIFERVTCEPNAAGVCVGDFFGSCDSTGKLFTSQERCPAGKCVPGEGCLIQICTPGVTYCSFDEKQVQLCNAEGTSFTVQQVCAANQTCVPEAAGSSCKP